MVNEGNIKALGTQMVLIAQTSLKEIERLQTDIVEGNKRLEVLTQCVIHMKLIMDNFIMKINNNMNAIRLLAFILGNISTNVERNLSKYQQLFANLDHLMDGLDILSSGSLSLTISPPGKLTELLEYMKGNGWSFLTNRTGYDRHSSILLFTFSKL